MRIVLLVVFLLAAVGCAGPEVSDGIDVSGGSEETAGGDASQEASSPPAPDEPIPPRDPSVDPSEPDDVVTEEEEASERVSDGTAPALVTSTTVQKTTPSPSTTTPAPEGTVPPAVSDSGMVAQAKQDLADRLGIAVDTIEVVSVQEVDWPDASIGCPQPDMVYAQVITNGSRIVLIHDGIAYSYHSAGPGAPFYCESPSHPVPGSEA